MAAAAVSYLDFLKLLLSLGPKLSVLLPDIQALVADFQKLFSDLGSLAPAPTPAGPSTLAVNEEEAEMERKIFAAMQKQGHVHASAFGDGSLLRGLFAFIKAHPELLTLLLGFLKPAAAG